MKRTIFSDAEIASREDFTSIGEFALASMDAIAGDAVAYANHWAGFTVSKKNNQEITVSIGRYWKEDTVYQNETAIDTNLFSLIPIGATDEKWVAIILRGEERTVEDERTVDSTPDAETQTLVQTNVPKTFERFISLVTQTGTAGPAPQPKPEIAESDCCIAFVRLTVEGVQEVIPYNDKRVKTLAEVEGRVVVLEVQVADIFENIASIETDIANLGAAIEHIPRPEIIRDMQRVISSNSIAIRTTSDAVAFRYDAGLFYEPRGLSMGWDINHPDANFRVKEGIRHNWANYRDERMELLNEDSPLITIGSRRHMTPAYDEVIRISHTVAQVARQLNQYASSSTDYVRREVAREEILYGPVKKYCTNLAQFARETRGLQVGATFFINQDINHYGTPIVSGEYQLVNSRGETAGNHTDKWRYVRQVTRNRWTEYYWDAEVETITVNGSTHSQTFLCSQPFLATGIDLNIAAVGADGNINLMVVECGENGTPNKKAVIAFGSLVPGDMVTGWNTIPIDLTMLETGKRYGIVISTTGDHKVWTSTQGQYAGGSMFVDTDGAFQQGDLLTDICFRVRGARFNNVRTTIEFNSLTLDNGITDIRILAKTIVPDGTALEWEVKPQGATTWSTMEEVERAEHPLTNLPPLCQIRAIMIGTQDLQPMIVLDSTLRGETGRHSGSMVAVSEEIDFGLTTTAIVCEYQIDGWIEAEHTFTPTLIIGGSTVNPTTVSTPEVLPTEGREGERIKIVATYALGSATQTCRLRPVFAASNVVEVPFIEDLSIHAL